MICLFRPVQERDTADIMSGSTDLEGYHVYVVRIFGVSSRATNYLPRTHQSVSILELSRPRTPKAPKKQALISKLLPSAKGLFPTDRVDCHGIRKIA